MVDPVGATLGSIALLAPIYDACDRLFHGYKLTRSFGDDFYLAQLQLYQQYSRLHETSRRRVMDLEKLGHPSDIHNESLETTSIIIETLSVMKVQFEKGHGILKKYEKHASDHGNTSKSSATSEPVSEGPMSSTAQTTPASSTADVVETRSSMKDNTRRMSDKSNIFVMGRGWFGKKNRATDCASSRSIKVDHMPPCLDSAAVNARTQRSGEKAKFMQKDTSLLRKVMWAKEDMDTLRNIIHHLRSGNEYLDIILVCKPPHDMSCLVNLPAESSSWLREARAVQGALSRLHESLRNMNTGSWQLSVQLMIDFSDNRDYVIGALNKLPLRDKAYYFNLQKQQSSQASATFLLAETMPILPCEQKDKLPVPDDYSAWNLDQAQCLKERMEVEGFKPLGIVWVNEEDQHWLYHVESQKAFCDRTIATLFREEDVQEKMKMRTRILLACLIALSYIHFSLVRSSCGEFDLSSFRFFESTEDDREWKDDDPLILKPYLSIGFGQRHPVKLGARSGASSNKASYIVGLGVLLYQIGCCVALDKSLGMLREMKERVSSDLHQLDRMVSARYAELVQSCLQYPVAGIGENAVSADRFVEGIVSSLFKLQEELC